jgi:hypothetical protein
MHCCMVCVCPIRAPIRSQPSRMQAPYGNEGERRLAMTTSKAMRGTHLVVRTPTHSALRTLTAGLSSIVELVVPGRLLPADLAISYVRASSRRWLAYNRVAPA